MNRRLYIYFAAGLAVMGVVAAYVVGAYSPLAKNLNERRRELKTQQQELKAARELLTRYDELKERADQVKLEWYHLQERIPDRPRIAALLKAVTRAATKCNIREFQFAPQALVAKEGFSEQPVRIELTCGYHQLGLFLSQLAALPRLVNTRELQITGKEKPDKAVSITAELTLVTYVFDAGLLHQREAKAAKKIDKKEKDQE
ncbi:type 4a pilus biogenesis protein PilO [bacterium]|nr:type 4a pilus biogenesis protein PilO [bacterium]